MDAREALAELTELSSQVEEAAVLGGDGTVEAATSHGAERLAAFAKRLLEAAEDVRRAAPPVTRVEVMLPEGGVFVVREGERTAVATTIPAPTAGLVLYDLRTCLRRIDDAPKPRRRRKKSDA